MTMKKNVLVGLSLLSVACGQGMVEEDAVMTARGLETRSRYLIQQQPDIRGMNVDRVKLQRIEQDGVVRVQYIEEDQVVGVRYIEEDQVVRVQGFPVNDIMGFPADDIMPAARVRELLSEPRFIVSFGNSPVGVARIEQDGVVYVDSRSVVTVEYVEEDAKRYMMKVQTIQEDGTVGVRYVEEDGVVQVRFVEEDAKRTPAARVRELLTGNPRVKYVEEGGSGEADALRRQYAPLGN